MDRTQTQAELMSAYARWKASLQTDGIPLDQFSPPLLLKVTESYGASPLKIVVYGQETAGWYWNHDLRREYPHYALDWTFNDLNTLEDFVRNDDAIDGLVWGYEQFDFAKPQPISSRSPFWRAFREIQKWPGAGVLWANVSRVDYQRASILSAPADARQRLLKQQVALTLDELRVLRPEACVFLTGPDYDPILQEVFEGLRLNEMDQKPVRELARVEHSALPARSYRTYHPNYLSHSGKWDYLDLIRTSVIGEAVRS
jgi:hypothetical protein